jgi:hypothetical protein
MMKMKTKRMTTRSKLGVVVSSLVFLGLGLGLVGKAPAQKRVEPYAVVGGSVFLESGRAVAGARVALTSKEHPERKQEQNSSPQGEFSFRVAPASGTYVVTATMKGYDASTKEVEIVGQEQVHKSLTLVAASK